MLSGKAVTNVRSIDASVILNTLTVFPSVPQEYISSPLPARYAKNAASDSSPSSKLPLQNTSSVPRKIASPQFSPA